MRSLFHFCVNSGWLPKPRKLDAFEKTMQCHSTNYNQLVNVSKYSVYFAVKLPLFIYYHLIEKKKSEILVKTPIVERFLKMLLPTKNIQNH